jgi:hypothetical protein
MAKAMPKTPLFTILPDTVIAEVKIADIMYRQQHKATHLTEQTRSDKEQTIADKSRQEKTTADKSGQDQTRADKSRQEQTRSDKSRQEQTRADKCRHEQTRANMHLDGEVLSRAQRASQGGRGQESHTQTHTQTHIHGYGVRQ